MINLDYIPPEDQKDFISSFWVMLQECEQKADKPDEPVLKHWVEQWYDQWNELTGYNNKPRWKEGL